MAVQPMPCQCKGKCDSRRCACLKSGQKCTKNCHCANCINPLNNIDNIDELTPCILANIKQYQDLCPQGLNEMFQLTCGCEEATLQNLIFGHECTQCGEEYRYSFCWDDVVEENHTWHCQQCGKCKEYREWHCNDCGRCTYGLSLPCETCGRKKSLFR